VNVPIEVRPSRSPEFIVVVVRVSGWLNPAEALAFKLPLCMSAPAFMAIPLVALTTLTVAAAPLTTSATPTSAVMVSALLAINMVALFGFAPASHVEVMI
jgi:hypothetical protein